MHSGSPASSTAASTGSQARLCQLARPRGAGFSGKLTALAPLEAVRSTSATHAADVPEREQHERDLTAGIEAAPLVDHEVVVGLHAEQREVAVPALEEAGAGEAGEGGEAQLGPDAVEVHVLATGRRVVAAGDHLAEPDRSALALGILPGHGVVLHRGVGPALHHPDLVTGPGLARPRLHDAGAGLPVPGRQAVLPHARVLQEVVVDRDQPGIRGEHRLPTFPLHSVAHRSTATRPAPGKPELVTPSAPDEDRGPPARAARAARTARGCSTTAPGRSRP